MEQGRWPRHLPKPVSVHAVPAPAWVGKDALHDFLYWHGTAENLRRVLNFVRGKPRRDTTEIAFMQADLVRARIDTRSRTVTFFGPENNDLPESVLDFDALADMFEGYIELGGYPDRDEFPED